MATFVACDDSYCAPLSFLCFDVVLCNKMLLSPLCQKEREREMREAQQRYDLVTTAKEDAAKQVGDSVEGRKEE